ncbi:DUF494 family protein [Deferrisoma camini]|uniref:DUF494 family protein n=1 Tax=Deferrisoma camini TaxID=1035120 RepID=UPI00046D38C1|nr:DUF494 family protein [Deferrisoma camini]
MRGRLFDVVAYITRRYGTARAAGRDPKEMRDELLDMGFEEDDVERALAWLRRLRERGGAPPALEEQRTAVRVPAAEEALRVSPAAWGLLLRLERAGVVDPALRELVLERALSLDLPEVGPEELRVLVGLVLLSRPGADEALVQAVLEDRVDEVRH